MAIAWCHLSVHPWQAMMLSINFICIYATTFFSQSYSKLDRTVSSSKCRPTWRKTEHKLSHLLIRIVHRELSGFELSVAQLKSK